MQGANERERGSVNRLAYPAALLIALAIVGPGRTAESLTIEQALVESKHLRTVDQVKNLRVWSIFDRDRIAISTGERYTPGRPIKDRFGIADGDGLLIAPPIFDGIGWAPNDARTVWREGEVGLLDRQGRYQRSAPLSKLSAAGLRPFRVLAERKWITVTTSDETGERLEGIVDFDGKWIVQPIYRFILNGAGAIFGELPDHTIESLPDRVRVPVQDWFPLSAVLGTQRRECASAACLALVRRDGSSAADGLFAVVRPGGEGYLYYERGDTWPGLTLPRSGFLKLSATGVEKDIPAMHLSGLEGQSFSEGTTFACRLRTSDERLSAFDRKVLFNHFFCNYMDENGGFLTKVNYLVGSPFAGGRAIACRVVPNASGQPISLCAWLDAKGNEGASTIVDEDALASIRVAGESVAVLQTEFGYRFFTRGGKTRDVKLH